MALPETPDPYIDWLLLSREATRMDFPNDPSFKRQMRVFLQSRTLLMVKYDSVDSQIKVTDDDIEKSYEEQFTPRFLVPGDHAVLAAVVQNNTDEILEVMVSLQANGFKLDNPSATFQEVIIPPAGRKRVEWKGTAQDVESIVPGNIIVPYAEDGCRQSYIAGFAHHGPFAWNAVGHR